MSTAERFRVNSPSVVWEDFEGEIVIVNLETGQYFTTRDAGSEIWRRLANGATRSAVEHALVALYDVEATVVAESLSNFVAELQAHALLLPEADSGTVESAVEPVVPVKRTFLPPTLEAYSDMQDLLLLDPIHEVDESGWPNPR
jgi:hypothetical protein